MVQTDQRLIVPRIRGEHEFTRKTFIRRGVGSAAMLGLGGGLLAACGDATDSSGGNDNAAAGKTDQVKLAGLYRDLNEENFFRINDGVQYGAKHFANAKAQPLVYHNDSATERAVVQGALNALAPGEKLALTPGTIRPSPR